jgi:hypothetical protein
MAINQTTTVQEVMDWCSLHTSLQNYFLTRNGTNEPAMTICNDMLRTLLSKPMIWKFNRKFLDGTNGSFLVTQYGVQDYRFAGASAFVLQAGAGSNPFGGVGVDMIFSAANAGLANGKGAGITVGNGGATATCQTLDPHPFSAGQTVFFSGLLDAGGIFNATFSFNALTHTSAWNGGFTILTVPDAYHFTFAAPANCEATITNIAIASNVLTVTCANSFKAGQVVFFKNMGTNTFLNSQQATIATASGSQFTAVFAHADVASGADTGTVDVCSGAPGFGTSLPAVNDPNQTVGVIGLPAWGWGESASMVDINSTSFPQPVTPDIEFVRDLKPAWGSDRNHISICMLADERNGVLRFRLSEPMSSYQFQFNIVYQQKAPVLKTPQSVFAWPDDLAHVLHEVGLVFAYRFAKGISGNEAKTQLAIANQTIAGAMASEERESIIQGLVPLQSLMR